MSLWSGAVARAADLDALHSLAEASRGEGGGESMCRPVMLRHRAHGEPAQLCIRGMRHPYLFRDRGQRCVPVSTNSFSSALIFISSIRSEDSCCPQVDISSGGGGVAICALITGPNMGGKSTALRLACLGAVLAQIGCFVPADECVMHPVDRIFTRLGAGDDIMRGMSTFHMVRANRG
jgi:DNA mismatch repair protein MSH6